VSFAFFVVRHFKNPHGQRSCTILQKAQEIVFVRFNPCRICCISFFPQGHLGGLHPAKNEFSSRRQEKQAKRAEYGRQDTGDRSFEYPISNIECPMSKLKNPRNRRNPRFSVFHHRSSVVPRLSCVPACSGDPSRCSIRPELMAEGGMGPSTALRTPARARLRRRSRQFLLDAGRQFPLNSCLNWIFDVARASCPCSLPPARCRRDARPGRPRHNWQSKIHRGKHLYD